MSGEISNRTARVTHLREDDIYNRLEIEEKIKESTGSVPGEFRWRSESDEIVFGARIN